jgi:hypothetical protein
MVYYTIWLSSVKKYFVPYFVPFSELREETFGRPYRRFKTRSLKNQGRGTRPYALRLSVYAFSSVATRTFCECDAHYDDNGESSFHSAKSLFQRQMLRPCCADV